MFRERGHPFHTYVLLFPSPHQSMLEHPLQAAESTGVTQHCAGERRGRGSDRQWCIVNLKSKCPQVKVFNHCPLTFTSWILTKKIFYFPICFKLLFNHSGMVLALSKGPEHPKKLVFFLFFFLKILLLLFFFYYVDIFFLNRHVEIWCVSTTLST